MRGSTCPTVNGRPTTLSEESGETTTARPARHGPVRRWILDPIDGTDPFLAGHRAWGTHIALEVDGDLELAALTRLTEQRRWWAVGGFTDTHSGLADAARRHARWVEDPLGPIVGLLEGRVDVVLAPGGASWTTPPRYCSPSKQAAATPTALAADDSTQAAASTPTTTSTTPSAQFPSSGKLTGRTSAPTGRH